MREVFLINDAIIVLDCMTSIVDGLSTVRNTGGITVINGNLKHSGWGARLSITVSTENFSGTGPG